MRTTIALLLAATASLAAGAHRTLLPQPRSITYGGGSLSIAGVEIGFASAPAAEDRFAAAELAAALEAASGSKIPVRDSRPARRAIVFKRTGPVEPLPLKDERPRPDGRESYRIEISPRGAEITAPSSAGLYYAVQTLRQMIEGRSAGAALPEARIHDWPALAYRGFMMDFSHGSILKEDEIRRQIDFLARWKANQYYFYSEVSIELKGYPLLTPAGRYTQEQVRRVIAYARERHIDVVPCLEYYGHLHDLFRVEKYADMAVLPHGDDLNPQHPGTAALLKDWIGQMAELFPSPWFHIGLDEPWELDAAKGVPPAELFRQQFETVTSLARAHGKRVLFWADLHSGIDIFNQHPELIAGLPADVVPVPWTYDAHKDFTPWVEAFSKAGKPQVVAPGITCWNEVFPDYSTTFANIDGFVATGRKHGAIGMINTGWTDDAQTIYRMALPGLAYGAAAAWQDVPMDRAGFFAAYAKQMYAPAVADEVGPALASLSAARDLLAQAIGRDTMHRFWDDALEPQALANAQSHREPLRKARLLAEDAWERIERARASAPDDYTLPSLRLAAAMLDHLGMKYLYAGDIAEFFRRAGPSPSDKDTWLYLELETSSQDHGHIADLMDSVGTLKDEYEQAWRQEWTTYRLATALSRWAAELEYWRALQARILDFTTHRKPDQTVPPLESFRPKR